MTTPIVAENDRPTSRAGIPPAAFKPLRQVVVVEDCPDIRAVVALALGKVGGLEVTCCEGGRVALDVVPEVMPELVLLDVMMPEMDGLETLKRLQADPRCAGLPVIFMTARAQPQQRADYLARGALAVIAKPFDPLTLSQQLRKLYDAFSNPAV